jgi:transposase
VGGDRAVAAEGTAGGAAGRRPAGAERHRPRAAQRLPLAGLPCRLWSADDRLQPLSSLGPTRSLAEAAAGSGGGRAGWGSPARQHHRQGAPLGLRRKRGAQIQAIGRSRGGRTTKIHAVVDGRGRPLAFTLTPGQRGDAPVAPDLLDAVPAAACCVADTAYDSDALRQRLLERGTRPVIPNNPTRQRPHPFDPAAYRLRNLIERAFCRLKDWRRVATRYDKLAVNYAATVALAILVTWWI